MNSDFSRIPLKKKRRSIQPVRNFPSNLRQMARNSSRYFTDCLTNQISKAERISVFSLECDPPMAPISFAIPQLARLTSRLYYCNMTLVL